MRCACLADFGGDPWTCSTNKCATKAIRSIVIRGSVVGVALFALATLTLRGRNNCCRRASASETSAMPFSKAGRSAHNSTPATFGMAIPSAGWPCRWMSANSGWTLAACVGAM